MRYKVKFIQLCLFQVMVYSAACYKNFILKNGWMPISRERVYAVSNFQTEPVNYNLHQVDDVFNTKYFGHEIFKEIKPQLINNLVQNHQLHLDTDNTDTEYTRISDKAVRKIIYGYDINQDTVINEMSTKSYNLRRPKTVLGAETEVRSEEVATTYEPAVETSTSRNIKEKHYEVTENTELVDVSNEHYIRSHDIHTTPSKLRPKLSFSRSLLDIFSKHNISTNDNLSNYALSRIPKRQVFVDNNLLLRDFKKHSFTPRHPLALFFPKHELFFPNYKMYRTLAFNYPCHNPSEPYKLYFDTDSSN